MFEFIIDFYFSNASSNSLNTLQAVAVETPLWSSMGASSLTSAPTMFAFVTVRMACKVLRELLLALNV